MEGRSMTYSKENKDFYLQDSRLVKEINKRCDRTHIHNPDDTMDASAEIKGDLEWDDEGVRLSIQTWNSRTGDWKHHRFSNVLMSPTEIMTFVNAAAADYRKYAD